jgi:hypothetical protein
VLAILLRCLPTWQNKAAVFRLACLIIIIMLPNQAIASTGLSITATCIML